MKLTDLLQLQLVPHANQKKLANLATSTITELGLPASVQGASNVLLEQGERYGSSREILNGRSSETIPMPILGIALSRVRRRLVRMIVGLGWLWLGYSIAVGLC